MYLYYIQIHVLFWRSTVFLNHATYIMSRSICVSPFINMRPLKSLLYQKCIMKYYGKNVLKDLGDRRTQSQTHEVLFLISAQLMSSWLGRFISKESSFTALAREFTNSAGNLWQSVFNFLTAQRYMTTIRKVANF